MGKSSSNDELTIRNQFDRICKLALKGEAADYYRHIAYRQKHEVLFSELSQKELDSIFGVDKYTVENKCFRVLGYDIEVKDTLLAEAIQSLSENKRKVVLLSYFMDMSDADIARMMNLVRSTVYEHRKKTIYLSSGEEETSDLNYDEDDLNVEIEETETMEVSKLEPSEISSYVNSLKDLAKYWYDTYFPLQSENLTQEEKQWVDKLNRIGIGYFRPLVMVIISRRDFSEEQRLKAFKAIERFIFICFRLGTYQATFRSSEYNRATRSVYLHEMNLEDLIEDIEDTTNSNIEYAIPNFVTRIEKNFDNNTGFYTWNPIRYFLYEYEVFLSQKNNIDKLNWMLFTKSEKDKVSIEHMDIILD